MGEEKGETGREQRNIWVGFGKRKGGEDTRRWKHLPQKNGEPITPRQADADWSGDDRTKTEGGRRV